MAPQKIQLVFNSRAQNGMTAGSQLYDALKAELGTTHWIWDDAASRTQGQQYSIDGALMRQLMQNPHATNLTNLVAASESASPGVIQIAVTGDLINNVTFSHLGYIAPMTAAEMVEEMQDLVDFLESIGIDYVVVRDTIYTGGEEYAAMTAAVNTLTHSSALVADGKSDPGTTDPLFNNEDATANAAIFWDGIHFTYAAHQILAQYDIRAMQNIPGLQLQAKFVIREPVINLGDSFTPYTYTIGGNLGTRVITWLIDKQDGAGFQTVGIGYDFEITPEMYGGGANTLRQSASDGGAPVTLDVEFTVVGAQNYGAGAITPAIETIPVSGSVALVASGVTGTPKWYVEDGDGELSNISGNNADFSSDADGQNTVRAEENLYNNISVINGSPTATVDGVNGIAFDYGDAYLAALCNATGDGFKFKIPAAFFANAANAIWFLRAVNFKGILFTGDKKIKRGFNSSIEATLTIAADDYLSFVLRADGFIDILINDVLEMTSDSPYDVGSSVQASYHTAGPVTFERPEILGTGITGFNSGAAVINVGTPPDAVRPSNVPALVATKVSNSEVTINGGGATDNVGVDHYITQRRVNNGAWTDLSNDANGDFQDTSGLNPSSPTVYRWRQKAVDAAGNESLAWTESNDVTITPPLVPAFVINDTTIEAGDTLSITNQTTGASALEWRVNPETDSAVRSTLASGSIGAALTPFLKMGVNEIEQTAFNSEYPGGLKVSHNVTVVKKVINNALELTLLISGLPPGTTLKAVVRAVDKEGNSSAWSEEAEATAT